MGWNVRGDARAVIERVQVGAPNDYLAGRAVPANGHYFDGSVRAVDHSKRDGLTIRRPRGRADYRFGLNDSGVLVFYRIRVSRPRLKQPLQLRTVGFHRIDGPCVCMGKHVFRVNHLLNRKRKFISRWRPRNAPCGFVINGNGGFPIFLFMGALGHNPARLCSVPVHRVDALVEASELNAAPFIVSSERDHGPIGRPNWHYV